MRNKEIQQSAGKRGTVTSRAKDSDNKAGVGPIVLGVLVFVIIGSALFQIINNALNASRYGPRAQMDDV